MTLHLYHICRNYHNFYTHSVLRHNLLCLTNWSCPKRFQRFAKNIKYIGKAHYILHGCLVLSLQVHQSLCFCGTLVDLEKLDTTALVLLFCCLKNVNSRWQRTTLENYLFCQRSAGLHDKPPRFGLQPRHSILLLQGWCPSGFWSSFGSSLIVNVPHLVPSRNRPGVAC